MTSHSRGKREDCDGPERVTAPGAAARTGHGQVTGGAEAAVLLDVRRSDEWRAGHAPGAVHLPLEALAAGAGLPAEAGVRPVVVICRSGCRSQQAVELLRARGVEAVDVVGGMRAWADVGLPVVGPAGGNGCVA
ncbi:rhodanese-like domain-containing protein [Streptomyces sp. NPDC020192]|uniref:rhodanese-like domain-containing protein n=1 Tax=Streptomyces sp. NPDC020192 TaxID=3365066 RepID=UPI00378E224B